MIGRFATLSLRVPEAVGQLFREPVPARTGGAELVVVDESSSVADRRDDCDLVRRFARLSLDGLDSKVAAAGTRDESAGGLIDFEVGREESSTQAQRRAGLVVVLTSGWDGYSMADDQDRGVGGWVALDFAAVGWSNRAQLWVVLVVLMALGWDDFSRAGDWDCSPEGRATPVAFAVDSASSE